MIDFVNGLPVRCTQNKMWNWYDMKLGILILTLGGLFIMQISQKIRRKLHSEGECISYSGHSGQLL